jgi:hypothetical protein
MSETEAKMIVKGYQETFRLNTYEEALSKMRVDAFDNSLFPIERMAVNCLSRQYQLSALLF